MSASTKPFRIRRLLSLPFLLAALVLELLPWGAVLIFAPAPDVRSRATFSYFDLTPYGYANFGPFLTAVGTCALLLLAVIFCLRGKPALLKAATILSGVLVVTSLMPLLSGLERFSLVGALITLALAAELACLLVIRHREAAGAAEAQTDAAVPPPAE